jgi:hypothetical protein
MTRQEPSALTDFTWKPQPEAASVIGGILTHCLSRSDFLRRLNGLLRSETGTRLADWIDHVASPDVDGVTARLIAAGYRLDESPDCWTIDSGMFPPVMIHSRAQHHVFLRVESVADFVLANGLGGSAFVEGRATDSLRRAKLADNDGVEVWCVERHGTRSLDVEQRESADANLVLDHAEAFCLRRRGFDEAADGFLEARERITAAADHLGMPRATDLFFAAERDYWQSRNRAARIQKSRQDALGLGWANHDHHTYRSSREHFKALISILEFMGFHCRERFYAGREAGWGAQVLEHSEAGVVIFADVDLSPEEVAGDFSHERLAPREALGTVGLWCQLHGEAFLEAGMHHLECQFDFDAAREQLRDCGVESMKPFTDLPYLRQAFTRGEVWSVDAARIDRLEKSGRITAQQAAAFREKGAVGSHLEILQRDDGYKGFNQTGINEIIRDTDPRTLSSMGA